MKKIDPRRAPRRDSTRLAPISYSAHAGVASVIRTSKSRLRHNPRDEVMTKPPKSTPAFLKGPIDHCNLILQQLQHSASQIKTIAVRCAQKAYQSRYYASASHSVSLAEKNLITIQELLFQVARFKRAYPAKNLEELLEIAYDIGLLQGGLFSFNGSLAAGRRGARKAVEKKRALRAETRSAAKRVRKSLTKKLGRPPSLKEIIHEITSEHKAKGWPPRSPSWYYEVLKNSS